MSNNANDSLKEINIECNNKIISIMDMLPLCIDAFSGYIARRRNNSKQQ